MGFLGATRLRRGAFISSVCLVLLCGTDAAALAVPPLTGPVVDSAQLLSPPAAQALADRLKSLLHTLGVQAVVLTVAELDGEPIESLSMRAAEAWQLGRAGEDLGVLLVFARQERSMRIEVGYGLESVLTDAAATEMLEAAKPVGDDQPLTGAEVVALSDALITYLTEHRDTIEHRAADGAAAPLAVDRTTRQTLVGISLVALVLWLTVGARRMARVPMRPIYDDGEPETVHRARFFGTMWDILRVIARSDSGRRSDSDNYRGGGGRFGGGGSSGS